MADSKTLKRDILALFLILISLLLLVSLVSFHPGDTSLFGSERSETVRNWIGIVGAHISASLFYAMGISSFLLVFIMFWTGLNVFRGITFSSSWLSFLGFFFLVIFVAIFAGLLNKSGTYPSYMFGGEMGSFLSQWGIGLTGVLGLYLITVFALLISLVLALRLSPARIYEAFREKAEARKLAQELAAEEKIRAAEQGTFTDEVDPIPQSQSKEIPQVRPRKVKPPLFEKVEYVVNEDGEMVPKYAHNDEECNPLPQDNPQFEDAPQDFGQIQENPQLEAQPEIEDVDPTGEEINPAMLTRNADFANKATRRIRSGVRKGRRMPPLSLLSISDKVDNAKINRDVRATSLALEEVLNQFKIKAQVINTEIGPVITRYELKMPPSVLVSRVASLGDTIAYNLAAKKVRVVAPIPGKAAVGVEIPNTERTLVTLGDLFLKKDIKSAKVLDFYLGLDVTGKPIVPNLKDAPHLIIAGATGQGKSVCINSILISFLYTCTPEDLRLILVDPKMVELKMFNGIEHLLTEVITDKRKSITALKWLVEEMERRYSLMEQASVRDITRYNEKMAKSTDENAEHFPYIVLVVDELNDLMVVNKKETEDLIVRLSQKARAAGIHLILATQRPSVDVITGVIKANFPSRIAFLTQSRIDSRTILDQGGSEQLLGKGDMLLSYTGSNELIRLQGAYLSEEEVMNVVDHLKREAAPEYIDMAVEEEGRAMEEGDVEKDDMYQQAIEIIRTTKKASASYLQRRLQIGYNRAARYIDMMEQEGVIGPQNGSKPREVLI